VTGYFEAAPRPLTPADGEASRALVLGAIGVTPYVDRVLELLAAAERGDPEAHALVIERDGTVAAMALFGPVAGASGTWHLSMLLIAPRVDVRVIGTAITEGVVSAVRDANGRLIVAELPGDPVIGGALSLLRANGFRQEGRIPDFFRDGVAMLFLRRDV
jgi:ribosomal protein S18 acetylase RimI-like enzyme